MRTATTAEVAEAETARARTFPVLEIFGPTLQGEGPQQGRPAFFVRFGGCDFRCSWCDSLHAVDPSSVREHAIRLSAAGIQQRLRDLPSGPDLVVISGGNPALLELRELVDDLHAEGFEVAVETQGSRWKPWLAAVDCLVVSPKGPSSRMDTVEHWAAFEDFMMRARQAGSEPALKIVVFDDEDLRFAHRVVQGFPERPVFLSVGTEVGLDDSTTVRTVLGRLRWLSEEVAGRHEFRHARVGAQQHVLTWGTRMGV